MHAHTHTCTHARTHARTHAHTHTHTYIQVVVPCQDAPSCLRLATMLRTPGLLRVADHCAQVRMLNGLLFL